MRRYEKQQLEIVCNKCGRQIKMQNDIPLEDVFHAQKTWGYFSGKDGVEQSWDLCETCYEQFVNGFAIPPQEAQAAEMI